MSKLLQTCTQIYQLIIRKRIQKTNYMYILFCWASNAGIHTRSLKKNEAVYAGDAGPIGRHWPDDKGQEQACNFNKPQTQGGRSVPEPL